MGYFDFLPNSQYSINGGLDVKAVKNILVRAKITDGLKALMSSYAEYSIADGEKPEHIAHRVYGRTDYHWIVLMFNEIHDPYFSWPLSSSEFERHMEKTYSGKALHVNTGGIVERGSGAIFNRTRGVPHDRTIPYFEVGSAVEQYDIQEPTRKIATGTIKSWNPNLWKIEVDDVIGVFRPQGVAARLTGISDPTALPHDIVCTNSRGDQITASLLRSIDSNQNAIRHFEDEQGEIVSPWYIPTREEGADASPLIERFVVGKQEVIDAVVLLPDGSDGRKVYSAITNMVYEEQLNESKRNIRVMAPIYIDSLIRELNNVLGR